MKIDCAYDELLPVEKLVPNPRNRNKHSDAQIERLAKLVTAHGWRYPIVVSKRSGFIVSGHGRRDVAIKLGMAEVPVDYQDFASEAEEYQVLISDNEIARWAELDQALVIEDLKEIQIDDLELLGLEKFETPKTIELEDIDFGDDRPAATDFSEQVSEELQRREQLISGYDDYALMAKGIVLLALKEEKDESIISRAEEWKD